MLDIWTMTGFGYWGVILQRQPGFTPSKLKRRPEAGPAYLKPPYAKWMELCSRFLAKSRLRMRGKSMRLRLAI